MPPPLEPGLAFWIVCDAGFAVGLMTHHRPKVGHLVWIAQDTFGDPPTEADVRSIERWRWPVFFPLGAALRRGIVTKVADVPVPAGLERWPTMRSGNRQMGWTLVNFEGPGTLPRRPANDSSIPIYSVVNDTALREMIVSNWRPAQTW